MRPWPLLILLLCCTALGDAAFQGGGPLLGQAEGLSAPPLKVRWKYKTSEEDRASVDGSPVIDRGVVYLADSKGILHALDLATAKPLWKFDCKDSFGTTPLVLGDRIYIGDLSGKFHAISREKGTEIWSIDTENPIHSSANALGDSILFGDDGADIYCVSTAGKVNWQIKGGDRINSAPSIGHGLAFVSGCDAQLRGIDIASGKEKFSADLGALAPGSPVFVNDRLIVGTDQGRVVCFSSDGQKQLWTYEKIGDKEMVYATGAAADGIFVIGARDRAVHAIHVQDGSEAWTFKTRGDVDGPPIICDGRVYVGSKDKNLYVLDLKTGQKLWEFKASRSIEGGVAIAQGVLVLADSGGTVYCLEK